MKTYKLPLYLFTCFNLLFQIIFSMEYNSEKCEYYSNIIRELSTSLDPKPTLLSLDKHDLNKIWKHLIKYPLSPEDFKDFEPSNVIWANEEIYIPIKSTCQKNFSKDEIIKFTFEVEDSEIKLEIKKLLTGQTSVLNLKPTEDFFMYIIDSGLFPYIYGIKYKGHENTFIIINSEDFENHVEFKAPIKRFGINDSRRYLILEINSDKNDNYLIYDVSALIAIKKRVNEIKAIYKNAK